MTISSSTNKYLVTVLKTDNFAKVDIVLSSKITPCGNMWYHLKVIEFSTLKKKQSHDSSCSSSSSQILT